MTLLLVTPVSFFFTVGAVFLVTESSIEALAYWHCAQIDLPGTECDAAGLRVDTAADFGAAITWIVFFAHIIAFLLGLVLIYDNGTSQPVRVVGA